MGCRSGVGHKQTAALRDPRNLNGWSTAKETTMKRFFKSMFAVLRKKNEPKSAEIPKRPEPTPLLEVRSQVKAGGFSMSSGGDRPT
jgi:hypothetical protein